ncbi:MULTISPECIES: hypothetical protein [Staphylococcus]|uniref:hypothetical protein n=1 Tax=Staphylococcus TaxID=1279 RepID=UPI0012D2FC28|nr:hypothetical protein [Staphylococcus shinii]MBO3066116.1 hypothetical protein [Staphylococcus shinii]MEC5302163.1 hypothetical protein [Staphylococcus shinii]QRA15995.1 hypothetical protein JMB28_10135 [Staphylococcus shinii]
MAEYGSLAEYEKNLTRIVNETEPSRIKKADDKLDYGGDKDFEKVLEDKKVFLKING